MNQPLSAHTDLHNSSGKKNSKLVNNLPEQEICLQSQIIQKKAILYFDNLKNPKGLTTVDDLCKET